MEENNFLIRQIQKSQKEEKTSELKLGEQLSQIILKGVSEMREKNHHCICFPGPEHSKMILINRAYAS